MDTAKRLTTLYDGLFDWLTHGRWGFSGWQIVIYTLVTTHITIASVTIFLHRSQAHRSVELRPVASHFFSCWLWLTTGIVTREWVAVHRKHHAARMLDAIAQIAVHVNSVQQATCLQRHAGMIVKGARDAVPETDDVLAVEARFTEAIRALRIFRS